MAGNNFVEAGFLLKAVGVAFLLAGGAKAGVATSNFIDKWEADTGSKIGIVTQKETPEQIAARTARIASDQKTVDSDFPVAGGLAAIGTVVVVFGSIASRPSNPYDRRATR